MKAYRGLLWKGKQNKIMEKKVEEMTITSNFFIIRKLQKHLVIVKNVMFLELVSLNVIKFAQNLYTFFSAIQNMCCSIIL